MKLPRVYPILDSDSLRRCGVTMETAAASFLEGGAEILQIRHKGHWNRGVFEAAKTVARLCRENGALLIINDRADFAQLLDAGLHVGQDDLSPRDARRIVGDEAVLGYSTHDASQVAVSGGEPVDYLAIGPIFPTGSKQDADPAVGLEEVRRARALTDKPLVAIGGINLENAVSVWEAGAGSVAIISGLLPTPCTARSLRERMEQWRAIANPHPSRHV